ncbi:SDR family oxidoreductase [Catellatospora bangladeshensis]|uniref:LysR family transcriptional regulator n=1 Tax=Catellatospora bangladeshensis TaxID=310355 RepID=A0A8J3NKW5_9ACTN|nr:SDR family oxidoreductase [Catellatospora bangladeshensis]GIF84432.1 LysR family transcriptional regulator [Catellatospora bangladeshensis]
MKIVIIGGTGLIGTKLGRLLQAAGHEVVAAAPSTGVDTITGAGLADALDGADVVVDVSNSPSFETEAVLRFFETSTRNLLAAESAAGVGHHVALSIVGADRITDSGYMRAKVAQENLIEAGPVPYTIVRATQFIEFVGAIADGATQGDGVHLPPALMQPIASDDVAAALAEAAVAQPAGGSYDIAGPERFGQDEFVRRYLAVERDGREVITDPQARYFGALLEETSLVPLGEARLGKISMADWLATR